MKPNPINEMPGCLTQPFEHTLGITLGTLCDLNGTRNGQTVDHAGQYRKVHGVGGIEYLPGRTQAGINQQVMG